MSTKSPVKSAVQDALSQKPNSIPSLTKSALAKPFVKWAGGKRFIVNQLHKFVPDSYTSYYEPFVGGGGGHYSFLSSQTMLT